jgi:hypothetical protein
VLVVDQSNPDIETVIPFLQCSHKSP